MRLYFESLGVPYLFLRENLISVIQEKIPEGKPGCSLCSRLRRGYLYKTAKEKHFNKIALGHHANDALETLFLNLFYTGRLAAMAPRMLAEDGNTVIRPLIYADEEEVAFISTRLAIPVMGCSLCPVERNRERERIKIWMREEGKRNPYFLASARRALSRLEPRHLWDVRFYEPEDNPLP